MAFFLFRLRRLYLVFAVLAIYGGLMMGLTLIPLLRQAKNDGSLKGYQTIRKGVLVDSEASLTKQNNKARDRKLQLERLPFERDPAYKQSVCPKTVSSVTKYSKWFRERYIPGIKIFIDKEDIRRVKELNEYSLPFGIKQANKTFAEILNHTSFRNPELPLHNSSQQCIKCAVVGCGGILNGSEAGAEIEGHDYVFRLNRAFSRGRHAKDVGKKTTFYTFFPESEHISDVFDENVTSLYAMFKPYDVSYALHMIKDIKPPNASRVNGMQESHCGDPKSMQSQSMHMEETNQRILGRPLPGGNLLRTEACKLTISHKTKKRD